MSSASGQILKMLFFCVLLLSLAACSQHSTRVITTPQTRELPGWQRPYEVDGQRYQPLTDHRGFSEQGVASWYGSKFHGRKTSNGETYNMYGLSAAHKTLPLGVYVQVTHLQSGRRIVVRVNDRGPFVSGRIIDLSYGAAQELGIVETGTAPVRVEALGFRQIKDGQTVYAAPASYDSGSFAVQIGAFSSNANADSLAARMRQSFGQAVVAEAVVNDTKLYRVRVGDFKSLQQAEEFAAQLSREGYHGSFVVAFQ